MLALFTYACAGEQGIPGPAGAPGAAGTTGTGTNGEDGDDGEPGENGDNGLPGGTGQNGTSCTVIKNGDATTIKCSDGSEVTVVDGQDGGTPGYDYNSIAIPDLHGTDFLLSEGEYVLEENPKYFANVTIVSATAGVTGTVTVVYNVKDQFGDPVNNMCLLATVPKGTPEPCVYPATIPTRPGIGIARLESASGTNSWSQWVNYFYDTRTPGQYLSTDPKNKNYMVEGPWLGAPWNVTSGATAWQASRKTNVVPVKLDELGNYQATISIAATTKDGYTVTYDDPADRAKLHRVTITLGGHSGPTATAHYDFVPAGTAVLETRDIVQTSVCLDCHGATEFHGHGGDRLTLENCVTCHAGNLTDNINVDAQSRESMDMKIMIHKIHAGGEVATIPGGDGYVFDNPATPGDESADNGVYQWWGHNNNTASWEKVAFPANIQNCTKCHSGSGTEVDNWKTKPSRAACGSCHDDINWVTGGNHPGGTAVPIGETEPTDDSCTICHQPDVTSGIYTSVKDGHDWTAKDARLSPEFSVAVTLDTPARGYYIAGESPKVYVKLTSLEGGGLIDHTSFAEDTAVEGCLATGCPAADGDYGQAYLFVSGPRGDRNPVLTTGARVVLTSPLAATSVVDLANASLILNVDMGRTVVTRDSSGGDIARAGRITVKWPASATDETLGDIAAFLNADKAFNARAIAYLETGKLKIRSRNLGEVYALQLEAGAVTTAVFGGNTAAVNQGQYYVSNKLVQQSPSTKNDPKVTWTTDAVIYELDPVDDLQAGTYVAMASISDRGAVQRGVNFKANSIATGLIQVKTGTEEKPPANNCDACHTNSSDEGYAFHDWALMNQDAVDTCGACHDYQPQSTTGANWSGAHPISKRVHGIHYGANLQYPLATVAYSGGDVVKGRNWDITLPQDVRNCETCHEDGTSSGSWATDAQRLPCMGCHDKDASTAHMMAMTYDPTPANPWSGDESESCQACH